MGTSFQSEKKPGINYVAFLFYIHCQLLEILKCDKIVLWVKQFQHLISSKLALRLSSNENDLKH